jgi:menaquinone-specific isochorismate synthase
MTVAAGSLSLKDACRQLADRVRSETGRRIEIPVEQTDPLAWLASQTGTEKLYWRNRTADYEIAGLGSADLVSGDSIESLRESFEQRIHRHETDKNIRYYGGMRFDPDRDNDTRAPEWAAFGGARFVLPRLELVRNDDSYHLAINLVSNGDTKADIDEIIAQINNLNPAASLATISAEPTRRTDSPGRAAWIESVKRTLEMIYCGSAQKLVLARRCRLEFDSAPDPWALLDSLRATTENCFLFGFQTGSDQVFVGATPERLYSRRQDRIESEALAGTRPRGESAIDDNRLASELAASTKERWEHRLVISGIHDALYALCTECGVDNTTTPMKLARLQHLRTRLKGILKPGLSDIDILAALHPSAAVGGYPSKKAVALLRGLEPFDRGWYAGPVGWVGQSEAEFAVGIRSALVSSDAVDLYSGAGIVTGSDPETEWHEIESKIGPFIRILGE